MTPDELRQKAAELLRIARQVSTSRTAARLHAANEAMRSSRTLITAARRQLGKAAQ